MKQLSSSSSFRILFYIGFIYMLRLQSWDLVWERWRPFPSCCFHQLKTTFFESRNVADFIKTFCKEADRFQPYFSLRIVVWLKSYHLWQWVAETGKLLRLLQRMGERGCSFPLLRHISWVRRKNCWLNQVWSLTFLVYVFRSFYELEAEMLQGQKLQVHTSLLL